MLVGSHVQQAKHTPGLSRTIEAMVEILQVSSARAHKKKTKKKNTNSEAQTHLKIKNDDESLSGIE